MGDDSFGDPTTIARRNGWADAFVENGLDVPGAEYRVPFKDVDQYCSDKFMEQVRRLDFSAIFFTKAIQFIFTYPYLKMYYGKAFNELALMIFDDISKLRIFDETPAIFIRQPLKEQASLAIEYIRRKIYDPSIPVINKKLKCTMLIKHV